MNKIMIASEFANLCGTTKATLRWYRKLGILEPVQIGTNGYAYYSATQIIDFNVIQALQSIGYSLEQIKAYNNGNLPETDSFYNDQINLLDQRITELKEKRDYLKQLRSLHTELTTSWGEKPQDGDWHIKSLPKESYLVMNAPIVDTSEYLQNLNDFQKICQQIGLGDNTPIVMFFNEKTLSLRNFTEGYGIATKINDPSITQEKLNSLDFTNIEKPYILTRAAGNYFAYLTQVPLKDNNAVSSKGNSLSNPMIDSQNAALNVALREGGTTKLGMLGKPLAAPMQKDNNQHLFLELTFAII
ncbi:MAG TPA: MerR family transcriptional regulator [Lactobacillaceae bacterium]|jgi:DNA-binding transcriptional MerR regulator